MFIYLFACLSAACVFVAKRPKTIKKKPKLKTWNRMLEAMAMILNLSHTQGIGSGNKITQKKKKKNK